MSLKFIIALVVAPVQNEESIADIETQKCLNTDTDSRMYFLMKS